MPRLGGKVAIVTGAGSGIDRAIAIRLSDEGARVALGDLDRNVAQKVSNEAENETLAHETDGTRAGGNVESLVGPVVESWGGLDVMVNNAGVGVAGTMPLIDEPARRRGGLRPHGRALARGQRPRGPADARRPRRAGPRTPARRRARPGVRRGPVQVQREVRGSAYQQR